MGTNRQISTNIVAMRRGGTLALGAAIVSSGLVAAAASRTSASPQAASAAGPAPISFNREILPILANNCFACHGPDEKKRETKFHFDTQEGMFAKRGVIEPGKRRPKASSSRRSPNPKPKRMECPPPRIRGPQP